MSKRSEREDKAIDRLEKENRELKSEVRHLNKRLKRLTKGYRAYLDKEPLDDEQIKEEKVNKDADKVCWDCSGNLKVIIILNRRFRMCDHCGKRTKTKIINS